MPKRFLTLGPAGTSHEAAARRYLAFHELTDAEIGLVDDFMEALERVRAGSADFIIQNSAHPDVYKVTETYHREVFVVDTFLCPTREYAVLTRRDVVRPRSIGLMPATRGYVDISRWEEVIFEAANPIVADNLLAGKYDSGLTFRQTAKDHPDVLRVDEVIGVVDTAWLVYGRKRRANGEVIGVRDPSLFT
ncbi:MAG TPA: hypothetical protein VNM90_18240 [Haliangium sp.]|nr:hypothetical protein [Haliangium sp.]